MTDDALFWVAGWPPMTKADFAAASRVPPGQPRPQFQGQSDIQK